MRFHTILAIGLAALLLAGCTSSSDPLTRNTAGNTGGSSNGSNGQGQSSLPACNLSGSPYPAPASSTEVHGSGATFPQEIIKAWALACAQTSTVKVSYGGGGSGKGIKDITNKDVYFGGSDAPLQPSEKTAANAGGNTILQFPETLGLVAVVYNANVPDGLRLDGETVGKIYTGDIKRWNDPAIQALNPGASLPDAAIAPVVRSDSSGTTFTFTDFLTRASPTWAQKMGSAPSKKPEWKATTISGNGNDGVASWVTSTPNTIGYVELAYVKKLGLKAAALKNKDGQFVAPTTAGASKAAASAGALPAPDGDWSTVSISYAPGADSYPVSTFTYLLVYDNVAAYGSKSSAQESAAFKAWAWWVLHDGQGYAETIGYAPLPASVVSTGDKALSMIH